MAYLLGKHPSVVVGGLSERQERTRHLQAFWNAFRDFHPNHPVYQEHSTNLDRVIPVAWHGDEGRGKKRGLTAVISIESVIGIYTS